MQLFLPGPGQEIVSVSLGRDAALGRIRLIADANGDELALNANIVLGGLGLSKQVAAQYDMTFGGVVYIYTFGDAITPAQLSGTLLPPSCNSDAGGYEQLIDYFDAHKPSAAEEGQTATVTLQVGRKSFKGVLERVTLQAADPSMPTGTYNFVLDLRLFPDELGRRRGSAGA
jgi:hypothetical protein